MNQGQQRPFSNTYSSQPLIMIKQLLFDRIGPSSAMPLLTILRLIKSHVASGHLNLVGNQQFSIDIQVICMYLSTATSPMSCVLYMRVCTLGGFIVACLFPILPDSGFPFLAFLLGDALFISQDGEAPNNLVMPLCIWTWHASGYFCLGNPFRRCMMGVRRLCRLDE